MSKDVKKIIWSVVYGISIVSLVAGFIPLVINLITLCTYDDFRVEIDYDIYGLSMMSAECHENLLLFSILAVASATLFILIQLSKIFTRRDKIVTFVLLLISCIVILAMLGIAVGIACYAYTLPRFNLQEAGSVDSTELSNYLDALAIFLQFIIPAALLFVAELFLHKLEKNKGVVDNHININ